MHQFAPAAPVPKSTFSAKFEAVSFLLNCVRLHVKLFFDWWFSRSINLPEKHGGGLRLTANFSQRAVTDSLREGTEGLVVSYQVSNRSKVFDDAAIDVISESVDGRLQLRAEPTEAAKQILGPVNMDATGHAELQSRLQPATSPQFYSRLVDGVIASDLPSDDALQNLGYAMASVAHSTNSSSIPVQFTYLGQFIAHDLAHTDFNGDLTDVENLASHAFDLSSIFTEDNITCANPDDVNGIGGARLGYTTPKGDEPPRLEDLPRDQDGNPGRSCLPDQRNDANLALSQMTVSVIKFYRFVFEHCASDVEEAQSITRRHIQSIVLHDFLPRILWDQSYLADPLALNTLERKVINPTLQPKLFQVPVEFATAFFRFGHSMVRAKYKWGNSLPNKFLALGDLITETHNKTLKTTRSRIDNEWVIDWPIFVTDQNSALIDCKTQTYLEELPIWAVDDPPHGYGEVNLAVLSLERGKTQLLPTAQMFQEWLECSLEDGAPELIRIGADDLISEADGSVGSFLEPDMLCELQHRTPLFYYTLREAEICTSGKRLGPLASRIVLETIHGAIAAAKNNIITGDKFSTDPKLPIEQSCIFRFSDLLACVGSDPI